MRAWRRLLSIVGLVALASCSESTAPEPQITGSWSGVLGGGTVTLTIQQAATGLVGSGAWASDAVVLTGTYTKPTVSLNITSDGFEPLNYTGTLNQDRIVGTVNGSGYTNQSLTLERQ